MTRSGGRRGAGSVQRGSRRAVTHVPVTRVSPVGLEGHGASRQDVDERGLLSGKLTVRPWEGSEGLSLRAEVKGACHSGSGKLRAFAPVLVVELGRDQRPENLGEPKFTQ